MLLSYQQVIGINQIHLNYQHLSAKISIYQRNLKDPERGLLDLHILVSDCFQIRSGYRTEVSGSRRNSDAALELCKSRFG